MFATRNKASWPTLLLVFLEAEDAEDAEDAKLGSVTLVEVGVRILFGFTLDKQ